MQTKFTGFGLLEPTRPQKHAWSGFFTRAAAYNKLPDDPAFFFDVDTMKPRINNPGFVKALEDQVAALKFAQPDIATLSGGGVRQAFIAGGSALAIHWADLAPYSHDPAESAVNGKLGYSPTPGSNDVYNAKTGQWQHVDTPNVAPFAGYGGWLWVVPKQSKNAEAAWDFLGHMGSKATLNAASKVQGTAANPCYVDGLDDRDGWIAAGFLPEEVDAYTGTIKTEISNPNAILELRIPGVVEYRDALELAISEVHSGQKAPQQGLDEAAAKWDEITDRLGRDSQKSFYALSLGLSQ
jgi:multiple sugar transport system substrate-binding protein